MKNRHRLPPKPSGRATEVGVRGWRERNQNRRGELQRVLSQEESYVDGKLSHAAFISIAILTFITFVGNFTQLQLSSALPIIVSEFHIFRDHRPVADLRVPAGYGRHGTADRVPA